MAAVQNSAPAAVKRVEETSSKVDGVAGTVEDVDNLKAAIQSGSAFEARREQRRNARGQTLRHARTNSAMQEILK